MSVTGTGNNSIDSLVYSSWKATAGQATSLTYSFLTRVPVDASSDDANGFKPMDATQQQATRVALASWAAVANITFTEVSGGGNIQLGTNTQSNSSGYAYLPDQGGDPVSLYVNNATSTKLTFRSGDFGAAVLIHELGHTLGLKHPGDYDSTGSSIDGPFLPATTDNIDYSQMSYNVGAGFNLNGNYGVTPALYDIQAMQYLYGANMSYHSGTDTYSFVRDSALQCVWDAGGVDTFDFSACLGATTINLNAGTFSETALGYHNISIAYNVTIERAIAGSGGSTIYANASGNVITGGAGVDTIYEGAGSDTISGGGGRDTVVFNKSILEFAISGTPSVLTVVGDGVDTLSGVSELRFSDQSVDLSAFSAVSSGSAGNDVLAAAAGSELIFGGGGIDVVHFSGNRSAYQVASSGAGVIVADRLSNGGDDLLFGVERAEYGDGTGLALDTKGEAGQLYRLYQMFGRAPDEAGMGFWLHNMDKGLALTSVAELFIGSAEFARSYGENISDGIFITDLYHNVLHRNAEAAGYTWWLEVLGRGVARADVLVSFTESAENIAAVSQIIPVGVAYTIWS